MAVCKDCAWPYGTSDRKIRTPSFFAVVAAVVVPPAMANGVLSLTPHRNQRALPQNGWGKKVGNPERPEENTSLEETRARALFRERKSPQARGRGEDVVVVVTSRVFPRVACIVVVVVGTDDEE